MKYVYQFLLVVFATVLHEMAESKCLPRADVVPQCRYESGDAWCAEHGKGNPYAYSDSCLTENAARLKAGAPDVSGLSSLRQGMNYSMAREIVLNAGWQGNNMAWQDVPEGGQVKDVYYNNGWHEVQDCASNGTAPCRFEFKDIYGNTLVMITEGECTNDNFEPLEEGKKCDLGLSRWFFE
jgi:hypothetical protein